MASLVITVTQVTFILTTLTPLPPLQHRLYSTEPETYDVSSYTASTTLTEHESTPYS